MTSTAPTVHRTPSGRPVAAGGWRRAILGLAVGVAAGVLALAARRRPPGDEG